MSADDNDPSDLADPKDRLIDTLLREALGKEAPPNLASRIMKRVERERRRFYWLAGGASVAAAILIGVAVWKFAMPAPPVEVAKETPKTNEPGLQWGDPPYTPPKPENDFKPSPNAWARGERIKTDATPKKVALGGYCNLDVAANSSLVNEGKDKAEQVLLESGSVTCQVDRHIGTFAVRTDSGTVAVTGTKFTVAISGEGNELKTEQARRRTMDVSVQEGAVELPGWGTTLRAGEKGGIAFGLVTNKGDNFFELRDEGKDARRFTPRTHDGVDKEMLEAIHKLSKGTRVQIAWVMQEYPRVTKMQIVWSPPDSTEHHHKTGSIVGEVTEKGDGGEWIRIRDHGGENEKYTPRWVPTKDNPKEGNLDKDMIRTLEKLNKGDKVKVEWVLEEHRRIVRIEKQD